MKRPNLDILMFQWSQGTTPKYAVSELIEYIKHLEAQLQTAKRALEKIRSGGQVQRDLMLVAVPREYLQEWARDALKEIDEST